MTKKLYYDCPIKALYMMKEFGVKFEVLYENKLYNVNWITMEEGFTTVSFGKCCNIFLDELDPPYFYIHPNSLDIFEPEDGDLIMNEIPTKRNYTRGIPDIIVFDDKYHTYKVEDNSDSYVVTGGGTFLELLQILTKDNKQFFMPEVEYDEKS